MARLRAAVMAAMAASLAASLATLPRPAAARAVQDVRAEQEWALPVLAVLAPRGTRVVVDGEPEESHRDGDEAVDAQQLLLQQTQRAQSLGVAAVRVDRGRESLSLQLERTRDGTVLETATVRVHALARGDMGSHKARNGEEDEEDFLFDVKVDPEQVWPSVPVTISCVHPLCEAVDARLLAVNVLVDGAAAGVVTWDQQLISLRAAGVRIVHLRNVGVGPHEVRLEIVDREHPSVQVWPAAPTMTLTFVSLPRVAQRPPPMELDSPHEGETAFIGGNAKGIAVEVARKSIPPSGLVLVEMKHVGPQDQKLADRRGVLSLDSHGHFTLDVSGILESSTWRLAVQPVDGHGQVYVDAPSAHVHITLAVEAGADALAASPSKLLLLQQQQQQQQQHQQQNGIPFSLFGPGVQFENRPPVKPHSRVDRAPPAKPVRTDAVNTAAQDHRIRCRVRVATSGTSGFQKLALGFSEAALVADLVADARLGLGPLAVATALVQDAEGFTIGHDESLRDFCKIDILTVTVADNEKTEL